MTSLNVQSTVVAMPLYCDLCDEEFNHLHEFQNHCKDVCLSIDEFKAYIESRKRYFRLGVTLKYKYVGSFKKMFEERDLKLIKQLREVNEGHFIEDYKEFRDREKRWFRDEILEPHGHRCSPLGNGQDGKPTTRLKEEMLDMWYDAQEKYLEEIRSLRVEVSKLKEILANNTLLDNTSSTIKEEYWDIVLEGCGRLSVKQKKRIRSECKYIKTLDDVRVHLMKTVENIKEVDLFVRRVATPKGGQKATVIRMLKCSIKFETSECQICYERECVANPKCRTCRYSYMCEPCEKTQINVFKKCPYCQTKY